MVATFGAKAPTGMPRWRSSRCLPNVAAWAELPRAHVSTKLGAFRLTQRRSSSSGGCSSMGWRRTASGPFCHSASIFARMLLTELASDRGLPCRARGPLAQHSFANCSIALLKRQNQVRSIIVLLRVSDSLKPMDTERASPRYSDIDVWAPLDIAEAMIEGQFTAVAAVRAARFALLEAALAAAERLRNGGRLVYVGAGTSGRLAVQDGAELVPTFSWPQERLLLLIAGGRNALLQSVEGAEDAVDQAARLTQQHEIGSADVVIAVAASGTTPFTLSCLTEAKRRGALTIGVANNRDTPILKEADHAILLDTGAEPIAGSTRMKAGTAQRITLNVFSSLVMILLGRVYDGLMVDLQAVSQKLVQRSESILTRLTGSSGEQAREALHRANGNVKLAVLLLHGCDVKEATDVLHRAGGQLRAALADIGKPGPEPADLSDLPTS